MSLALAIITFGTTSGFFIWLIIYLFVLHQEKGEKFVGWLARLVIWTGKKAEKTATAMDIQSKLNSFVLSINTEVNGLLPYGLKIRWIPPELDKESFITNDKVVVMLDFHSNQDENFSKATILYMNKAVIPDARPHIHTKLSKAIDLMMTKKALYSFVEARSSFGYFIDSVLRPEIEKDSEIKDFCKIIDSTDERGLFTRVLLKELLELGRRKAGVTETGDTVFESNNFTNFLNQIAQKETGQDVPLTFIGRNIKVAIMLAVRSGTEFSSVDSFIKRIKEKIKLPVNAIYIFARGTNTTFAKLVTEACKTIPELALLHEEEFPTRTSEGGNISGYCSIFYNRKVT